MNKDKTIFVCNECGEEFAKWSGKCLSCGQWNTLKEFKISHSAKASRDKQSSKKSEVVNLGKIESKDFKRISTGIGEFDRVLGPSTDIRAALSSQSSGQAPSTSSGQAGIVPGSVILLGGDPGIGKSTLLLQVASNLAKENPKSDLRQAQIALSQSKGEILNPKPLDSARGRQIISSKNKSLTHLSQLTSLNSQSVLYVSGEESAQQIKMRLDRLPNKTSNLQFLAETDIDNIITQISNLKSQICIIDSIQTMYDSNFPSTPGSIVQVRECALRLQQFAKENNITIFLVGHVTKDGNVAGPRMLEHLVDVVLYLEGERFHSHRILRGVKNRFGATDEIGIFEMGESGLVEVNNPSQLFLQERSKNKPGSVITVAMEGSRPILVEVQALTAKTVFGYPKRTASGFDLNRLNLLIAVLCKKLRLPLDSNDIYLNIVGGIKLKDPAVDLAVCAAIISSFKNQAIKENICLFGEVGLLGEIRQVNQEKKRAEEAKRLGFQIPQKINSVEQLVKDLLA